MCKSNFIMQVHFSCVLKQQDTVAQWVQKGGSGGAAPRKDVQTHGPYHNLPNSFPKMYSGLSSCDKNNSYF